LMSIVNLAALLSHELGALLTHWLGITETNFDHLWQLVLLTNLTTLLPLPLLFLLPMASSQNPDSESHTEPLWQSPDSSNLTPIALSAERLESPISVGEVD